MKRRLRNDDQLLVERLRARDRSAQSELFSRLRSALLRLASRIAGNRALADDVIQEAWLASIVLNKARSHRRRESRCRPFSSVGAIELESSWGRHQETPELTFIVKETARRAERALGSLRRRERSVIVLRDFQGASPTETCDILDLSDLAQRVHLCRARANVRRALEQDERLCA